MGSPKAVLTPTEVSIIDREGDGAQANHWPGLRALTGDVLKDFWGRSPWSRHACSLCMKNIEVGEGDMSIHACVIDGTTSTRHACCGVKGCEEDLYSLGLGRR